MTIAKSLKDNNRMYISLFVVMNALVIYAVAQTSTIAFAGFKALLTEATNILPIGFAFIVATVSNGLLSADMKARLVFLRWNHALPGHRSFSKYAVSDPRIDIAKLKKACGKEFPDDFVEQNRTWYRFYKTVENDPAVAQVHRDFLLMRDYTGLAALFVVVFGATALIVVPFWRVSLAYCLLLVVQFGLTRQSAATYGARFVTTVLAQKAAVSKARAAQSSTRLTL